LFLREDYCALLKHTECLCAQKTDYEAAGSHFYRKHLITNQIEDNLKILWEAEIVEREIGSSIVGIGSLVTCHTYLGAGFGAKRKFELHGGSHVYKIGSYIVPQCSDLTHISYDSLIGRALMGSHAGQTRKVDIGTTGPNCTATDYQLEVLKVE
jgi:transcription elongation GreA/GreB family factor